MWKKTRRSNSDTGRALFLLVGLWYTLSGCEYRARKIILSSKSGNFQKSTLISSSIHEII